MLGLRHQSQCHLPIVPDRPICNNLSTERQILHAATYRYYNMHIEWHGESYRLVCDITGKYGPWATGGEMSTIGDCGTDGNNIYQIMPVKPKRVNIILEGVDGVGIVEFKPNWYYFRNKDKHMLIYGPEIVEGPLNKEIKLRNCIARADSVLIEEMT